jgi:hypothetical protein
MIGDGDQMNTTAGVSTRAAAIGVVNVGWSGNTPNDLYRASHGVAEVCQQTGPTQAISAEALTPETATTLAAATAAATALMSNFFISGTPLF